MLGEGFVLAPHSLPWLLA